MIDPLLGPALGAPRGAIIVPRSAMIRHIAAQNAALFGTPFAHEQVSAAFENEKDGSGSVRFHPSFLLFYDAAARPALYDAMICAVKPELFVGAPSLPSPADAVVAANRHAVDAWVKWFYTSGQAVVGASGVAPPLDASTRLLSLGTGGAPSFRAGGVAPLGTAPLGTSARPLSVGTGGAPSFGARGVAPLGTAPLGADARPLSLDARGTPSFGAGCVAPLGTAPLGASARPLSVGTGGTPSFGARGVAPLGTAPLGADARPLSLDARGTPSFGAGGVAPLGTAPLGASARPLSLGTGGTPSFGARGVAPLGTAPLGADARPLSLDARGTPSFGAGGVAPLGTAPLGASARPLSLGTGGTPSFGARGVAPLSLDAGGVPFGAGGVVPLGAAEPFVYVNWVTLHADAAQLARCRTFHKTIEATSAILGFPAKGCIANRTEQSLLMFIADVGDAADHTAPHMTASTATVPSFADMVQMLRRGMRYPYWRMGRVFVQCEARLLCAAYDLKGVKELLRHLGFGAERDMPWSAESRHDVSRYVDDHGVRNYAPIVCGCVRTLCRTNSWICFFLFVLYVL